MPSVDSPDFPQPEVITLGWVEFERCDQLQKQYHARALEDGTAFILCVEHPPVLTLGKHASEHFMMDVGTVPVVRCDRGGEVTAHMPGQAVVYPIVPLRTFRLGPKAFICLLEQCVIDALAECGIRAHRDAEHPGVWVGQDKICAVGVRIDRRVSRHGIALNVDNSLDLFSRIVPCGIRDRGVTRLVDLCSDPLGIEAIEVGQRLAARICEALATRLLFR